MRRATAQASYSYFSPRNPITFTARPGETFEVETLPNCGRQFDAHTGRFDESAPRGINASAGNIAVEGAVAGGNLIVHVLDIRLGEYGYTKLRWPSVLLPQLAGEKGWEPLTTKVVRIRDRQIEWSDRLKIPAAPMIGCMGVAQAEEVSSCAHNGPFGGNFDIQEIAPGCRVHLPVLVDGAMLHIGDIHAVQGDGEIDGAGGIETAGGITMKVELAQRPKRFRNPRIETDDWIAATGFARPAEAAFSAALGNLIHWMVDEFGFKPVDAHMLLAQVLEARITQLVNPLYTCICKVRRQHLVP
jgi:acetamidase/formamidase